MATIFQDRVADVCESILAYLVASQDVAPGEYHGAFWSEKGYHGPLLDYHAGGSHHHRAGGSAALALWLVGMARGDEGMKRQGELCFDWLAARQAPRGGYPEIQNNEVQADWEGTGLEELSSIAMGFVAHGLGGAVLAGLPPKKSYLDCLKRAGHWQLSIEWPPGSGVFPHHERSPYNTLNAAGHACETLSLCYAALRNIYDQPHNLFLQGALRAVRNILSCQWENGCFPYRDYGHTTINYTSLVMWCVLNALETLGDTSAGVFPQEEIDASFDRACDFLRGCIDVDGRLLWENGNENSTAKYNMWTYVLTANVLLRCGGRENQEAGERLLEGAFSMRTKSGLLPMRDRGEEITECAFMQADMLLFLLPFSGMLETEC